VTVGVVLPVLNGAGFVEEAVDSVLAQSHDDLELVVVDDGSTDETAELVTAYDDPRLTLVEQDQRAGVAASRNRGVDTVAGDVLAFIDHDDVWHTDKLARHLATHDETAADLVYSDVRNITADGEILTTEAKPDPRPVGEPLVRQLFFGGGSVITTPSSVTIRRAAWTAIGGQDPAYHQSSDVDLYVRLAGGHPFARVSDPLVDRRLHEGNRSADYRGRYRSHERIIERATDRYPFLDADDVRRKRARMAYSRATSALAAGDGIDAVGAAVESLRHDRCLRPGLVGLLGGLEVATGPVSLGQRLYLAYDRRTGGTGFVRERPVSR